MFCRPRVGQIFICNFFKFLVLRLFLLKLGVLATLTCIRILFCNKNFRFVFQSRFREAFYKENMLKAIVQRLVTDNEELQGYCANAIFKVK